MSSGQRGWYPDSHLVEVSEVFEMAKTCTQNRSAGDGAAGESYRNPARNIGWRQKARERVRILNDLEVISCFPKNVIGHLPHGQNYLRISHTVASGLLGSSSLRSRSPARQSLVLG